MIHCGIGQSRQYVAEKFRKATGESTIGTADEAATPAEIGRLFLGDHLLAFEVTSIVLLVAAVGGVILGSAVPKGSRS